MARNYCVINDKLYNRSLVELLLRCIGPDEAQIAILEVHTGICGDHLGGKNLAFNNQARHVLANHEEGLRGLCQKMQTLSTLWSGQSSTRYQNDSNPQPVPFLSIWY